MPPLEQIEAFLEAARAPSFRAAADKCALSPAAFSRRIQAFSDHMGVALFESCDGGRLRLTEAGVRCARAVEPAYLHLRRAAAAVADGAAADGRVRLSLSHSLAVGWLIPRMGALRAAHPDINLALSTTRDASALRRGDVDLAICYSDIDLSGLASQPLFNVTAAPVAAPHVARAFEAEGCDLARRPLLSVRHPPDVWSHWASAAGWPETLAPTATFDVLHAMYETAAQGLGVALGASPTIAQYLESGRLVRLDLPAARMNGGYRLGAPLRNRRRRDVARIRDWLMDAARSTPDLFDAPTPRSKAAR